MMCKRGANGDRWPGGSRKTLSEAKILNTLLDLVFTCRIGFHEDEISEMREKVRIKEDTLMEKYLTTEHLKALDRHKSNELRGWTHKCWGRKLALRPHCHLWKFTVTWRDCWRLEERKCCPYLKRAKNADSGKYRPGNLTSSLWAWWSKTSHKKFKDPWRKKRLLGSNQRGYLA